jgi:hypothetical protein
VTGRFTIDDRLGTFEAVASAAPGHLPTLCAIRETVADLHPDATESASIRERSISWGFGVAKKSSWYAYAMPHKNHVNLGFFQGVHLPDPEAVLEGTGKALRHLKLKSPDEARRPAVRALLASARDERAQALNLTQGS